MPLSDPLSYRLTPLRGVFFEDTIDGYFPLSMSLEHLLERHGFCAAWVTLCVAPMMNIPALAPEAPVPLRLDPSQAGQLDWLSVALRRSGEGMRVSGWGKWRWAVAGPDRAGRLPESVRLAEPAFLRGVGFYAGSVETGILGGVDKADASSDVAILQPGPNPSLPEAWQDALCWNAPYPYVGALSATATGRGLIGRRLQAAFPGLSGEVLALRVDGDTPSIMSRFIADNIRPI